MQQLVNHRWFALADLILVFTYGAAVTILPQLGGWLVILLLVPLGIRLASGNIACRSTILYILLALIAVTAGIGTWAAYDQQAAWEKFWIIIGSVLIFSILINQPQANLGVVVGLVGLLGVIIAIIFLFNNDWTNQSSDLGVIERAGDWFMALQLSLGDITIQPNFVGGLLAIIFPLSAAASIHYILAGDTTKAILFTTIGIVLILGLFLTSSRGAWLALILGLGSWLLWRASSFLSQKVNIPKIGILVLFLMLVIIPSTWIFATYPGGAIGLSQLLPGLPSGESRLNLALNTSKLIGDYPFTGGGLQSFPGLYSQYIMVTPYFLFAYSHNFYLDVILEQGFAGGLAILAVIIGGALFAIMKHKPENNESLSSWLIEAVMVSTLIILIHGLVDDPLYGDTGTPLMLLIPGIALILANGQSYKRSDDAASGDRLPNLNARLGSNKFLFPLIAIIILMIGFFGFRKSLLSNWYANLGAVEMSRNELHNWPQNKWNDNPDVSSLEGSESLFMTSLEFSPNQRTAWHRLGLISMQERDFGSAQDELEIAFRIDPEHRGIRKSLGYAYVWGDRLDQAERVLEGIAEAKSEMEAYTWWWDENNRSDLSSQANALEKILDTVP
jgi:O-antigen ligase